MRLFPFLPTLLSASLLLVSSLHGQERSRGGEEAGNPAVPPKAIEVYRYVQEHGRPPRGYVGGREWQNRERRLPRTERYREYDVNPKRQGRNRGPERLIIGQESRKGWYTADHYRTFIPLKRPR